MKILSAWIEAHPKSKVLELGTSLGFTTATMAFAGAEHIITIEGNPQIQRLATSFFQKRNLTAIQAISGKIEDHINELIRQGPYDLIYIDANHTYQATIKYVTFALECLKRDGVIVLADIYWSRGMTKAWNEVISWPIITRSIDMFEAGFIFVAEKWPKQHFKLRL